MKARVRLRGFNPEFGSSLKRIRELEEKNKDLLNRHLNNKSLIQGLKNEIQIMKSKRTIGNKIMDRIRITFSKGKYEK